MPPFSAGGACIAAPFCLPFAPVATLFPTTYFTFFILISLSSVFPLLFSTLAPVGLCCHDTLREVPQLGGATAFEVFFFFFSVIRQLFYKVDGEQLATCFKGPLFWLPRCWQPDVDSFPEDFYSRRLFLLGGGLLAWFWSCMTTSLAWVLA